MQPWDPLPGSKYSGLCKSCPGPSPKGFISSTTPIDVEQSLGHILGYHIRRTEPVAHSTVGDRGGIAGAEGIAKMGGEEAVFIEFLFMYNIN